MYIDRESVWEREREKERERNMDWDTDRKEKREKEYDSWKRGRKQIYPSNLLTDLSIYVFFLWI